MKISVVGLGFVGLPLYLSIVNKKKFDVIGFDEANKSGLEKIKKITNSKNDYFNNPELDSILSKNKNRLNFSTNPNKAHDSDFIFVCLPFNIDKKLKVNEKSYYHCIKNFYSRMKKNSILILNSTLPPGYTLNIIKKLKKDKLFKKDRGIVFSPERVEPGKNYLKSIVSSPRVFSSDGNKKISNRIKKLFFKIFNIKKSELIEFDNFAEAEMCKILENSYRAANIALIEEWGVLAEHLGINIYPIIKAIKTRKTHSNIMRPGLGVGGYCLTKDPYFAKFSSSKYLSKKINFPFIDLTMKINSKMHNRSILLVKKAIKKKNIKKILVVGISYTQDVNDLRNSRAVDILKFLEKENNEVSVLDTTVKQSHILNSKILNKCPKLKNFDLVVLINKNHGTKISFSSLKKKTCIIDLNNFLEETDLKIIKKKTNDIFILGRGDI